MKKFLLLIPILSIALCSSPEMKVDVANDPLNKFFVSCETDLQNSANVIAEKELIKNLTHLLRMGAGGMRYYPLERDSITAMIKELSTYDYTKCYLINKWGTVIYSMYDDKLFSKSITLYPETPVEILFNGSMNNKVEIHDVTLFPEISSVYEIYFSVPVIMSGDVWGVLIAAVDINKISPLLSPESVIVDRDGVVRYSEARSSILSDSTLKEKNEKSMNRMKAFETEYNGKQYRFRPYARRSIAWFVGELKK